MEQSNIRYTDWQTTDGGYSQLGNYFVRFWWPTLGLIPGALYIQLLCYTRDDNRTINTVTVDTLADALGVDKRDLIGWKPREGRPDRPGAIKALVDAGLIEATKHPNGRWEWLVLRHPPLLTGERILSLPTPTRARHSEWLTRFDPNMRSVCGHTISSPTGAETVSGHTPTVSGHTEGVSGHTRTLPTLLTQQEREEKEEKEEETKRLTTVQPSRAALAQVWEAACTDLRQLLPPHDWQTWLRPSRLVEIHDSAAIVTTPNSNAAARLERMEPHISNTLSAIVNRPVRITYEPAGRYTA